MSRPHLVDLLDHRGVSPRGDWMVDVPVPDLEGPSAFERACLAQHWTDAALEEHASIALIARLSLQLLSLGAPADLVEETNRALADQTQHARLCFALASAYRGAPVGPTVLSTESALGEVAPAQILRSVIRGGCVGEARAALEAAHALSLCEDYAVSEVLEQIANDEARHADLAFRVVKWLLDEMPELRQLALEEFATALSAIDADGEPAELGELRRFGVLDDGARARVRRRALGALVGPRSERLFEGQRPPVERPSNVVRLYFG